MAEKINLNIQPQASIYAFFPRLSYDEWHALAEFVDNSTASYYMHRKELEQSSSFSKLSIIINYDPIQETITIEDNAFGMELEEFKRAILLGLKPPMVGRNEYGYGLKTSASWFGMHWSVESTQLDSQKKYSATIDIDDLVSTKKNDTDIIVDKADYSEHYTIIRISKLNRKLNTAKIKKNIINVLNSMYRRDLKAGNIEIIYNGTTLSFADYPILHFRGVDWKKDVKFSFEHEKRIYTVSGFVGIMEPGGVDKTGFALFRNNRAIDTNFKPTEIFGSDKTTTQIALRLFGELDMDSFDVSQAKDGFGWDSELMELFVLKLKNEILDYIDVAKLSKAERNDEEKALQNAIESVNNTDNNSKESNVQEGKDKKSETQKDITHSIKDNNVTMKKTESIQEEMKLDCNKFHIKIKESDKEYNVKWEELDKTKFLYSFSNNELIVNIKHEFIKGITNDTDRCLVSKIILAFVISEEKSKALMNDVGLIRSSTMHNNFDQILSKLK